MNNKPRIFEESTFQPEDWLELVESDRTELLKDNDKEVREFPNGAKSSHINSAFQLVPAQAVALVSRVLYEGQKKYGKENWYGLPIEDNLNHALRHVFAVLSEMQCTNRLKCSTGNSSKRHQFTQEQVDELSHASCRLLFALEQVWDSYLGVRATILQGNEVEDV